MMQRPRSGWAVMHSAFVCGRFGQRSAAAPPSRGADSATPLTWGRESARIREHIVGRRLQRDRESLRACGH